jgi:hypothetical protein
MYKKSICSLLVSILSTNISYVYEKSSLLWNGKLLYTSCESIIFLAKLIDIGLLVVI